MAIVNWAYEWYWCSFCMHHACRVCCINMYTRACDVTTYVGVMYGAGVGHSYLIGWLVAGRVARRAAVALNQALQVSQDHALVSQLLADTLLQLQQTAMNGGNLTSYTLLSPCYGIEATCSITPRTCQTWVWISMCCLRTGLTSKSIAQYIKPH